MSMRKTFFKLFDALALPIARAATSVVDCRAIYHLKRRWRLALWKARLQSLGDGCLIYSRVVIHFPKHVSIGARSSVAEFVHMWGGGGISIGNDVMIASHVIISSQTHDLNARVFRESYIEAPCIIEDNVWIGAGAIVLPGVRIGSGSMIGAGSVVTKTIPPRSLAVGIPARVVRNLDR